MPLPKPRGGKKPESKKDFISRCAGDDVANKEFPDQKQRLGYCYTAWERRKAKASYVVSSVDDEFIYVKANMVLPPMMAEKMKEMPESGPGYHNVSMKFKNGKSYSGVVKNCDMFETDDEDIENENSDDLDEIEMSDTSYSMKKSAMAEKKVEVEVELEDEDEDESEDEGDDKEEESDDSEEEAMSKVFAAVNYSDKSLYDKVRKEADTKFGKDSYVKNLWVLKEYKKRGGKVKYSGEKPSGKSIKKQVNSSVNSEMKTASDENKVELQNFIYSFSHKDFTEDYFVEAASNEGKTLNKPFRLPKGSSKKFGVYVKNDKGNTVVVKFGDPNLSIKRDNPERRKNFRARHGCDNPGPKWKAKYWACKFWSKKPVSQLTSSVDIDWENLPEIEGLSDVEVIEEEGI